MHLIRIVLLLAALLPHPVHALSRSIDRDIEFPKDFNSEKAEAVRKVIRDEQFNFVDGTVSYWPPDWGTRLSFEGDVKSLNIFIEKLRELKGFTLRLILYKGRNDELRQDSDWQLDYSHAQPNQLTIHLNLGSQRIDFAELKLPPWPAKDN